MNPSEIINFIKLINEYLLCDKNIIEDEICKLFKKQLTSENFLELYKKIYDDPIYDKLIEIIQKYFCELILKDDNILKDEFIIAHPEIIWLYKHFILKYKLKKTGKLSLEELTPEIAENMENVEELFEKLKAMFFNISEKMTSQDIKRQKIIEILKILHCKK